MKIKLLSIEIVLLCLTFFEPSIVPHTVFLAFKYITLLYLFFKYVHRAKYMKSMATVIALYALTVTVSSMLNQMAYNTVIASALYGVQILATFFLINSYMKKRSLRSCLKLIFMTWTVILLINDIAMLFVRYDFSNPGEEYLIGSKFAVSYFHCFWLALFYAVKKKKKHISGKLLPLFGSVYVVFICAKVTCTTGVIAAFSLIIMILLSDKVREVMTFRFSPIVLVTAINILIFGSYGLFQTKLFQHIMINVLRKSSNMTGRFQIWNIIFGLIAEKPLLGHGYYSGAVNAVLNYGNPQNGILKLLLDSGIIGLLLYAAMVLIAFSNKNLKKSGKEIYPIVCFYYAMLIASFVEINLTNMVVYMALAIIFALNDTTAGYMRRRKL